MSESYIYTKMNKNTQLAFYAFKLKNFFFLLLSSKNIYINFKHFYYYKPLLTFQSP